MKVTREQAVADVADALFLDAEDVDHELDLEEQGLDSVRLMQLVDRWRDSGAKGIDFIALAEDRRLSRWLKILDDIQT
ncbi:phosphopantetheine-binding protein [Rhodococcus artemisiae]|uniref:Phosphopantetheine-binding protein n=1 Tax=Rhodococcus artemisiae TaxID=714159 RepID=A0ABU7LBY2_9NOCA|nr:phosphopantetheine-binding protein [Rhodococcus artemisiae]MEE2059061.1 phosphopantetheine-binding protein [Rhodococcus artemisiae]